MINPTQLAARMLIFAYVFLLGCSAQREVMPDPFQISTALPSKLKSEVWPAIIRTLVLQGERLNDPNVDFARVTIRRPLTENDFSQTCDGKSAITFDTESWRFTNGYLEVRIWLDERQTDDIKLNMEGLCRAVFDPPRWRYLLAPCPICLLQIFIPYKPRTAWLASSGEVERELTIKLFTTIGYTLPPSLAEKR